MVRLRAPAKLNLFLRVLAREESGFHQLETLFAGVEFSDDLTVQATPSGIRLDTSGLPMGRTEENLAFRAAEAFLAEARLTTGAAIRLEKRIPLGAGLGGGSSDAAAVLKALAWLHPDALSQERILEIGGTLGSDVPFFLCPSPLALAWGRGDRFLPLSPLAPAPVLLAVPSFHVSTPRAFSLLAESRAGEGTMVAPGVLDPDAFSSWDAVAELAHNDFEPIVFGLHPEARELVEAIQAAGACLGRLTGSGSALFGLFEDEASLAEAATGLEASFPEVEFIRTRTLSTGPWIQPRILPEGENMGTRDGS